MWKYYFDTLVKYIYRTQIGDKIIDSEEKLIDDFNQKIIMIINIYLN